jgi:hypothetical protein
MVRDFKTQPWMTPFLVAGLVLPVSAAFVLLGPYFAFLVAGFVAVVVVLVAALRGNGPPPIWIRRRRARHAPEHRPDRSREPSEAPRTSSRARRGPSGYRRPIRK